MYLLMLIHHYRVILKYHWTISNCCFLSQNNLILASSYDFHINNTQTWSSHFLSLQPLPRWSYILQPHLIAVPQMWRALAQLWFPRLFPVPTISPPTSPWKFLSVKTPSVSLLQGVLLWPFSSHSHTHSCTHTEAPLHHHKPLRWDLSCTVTSRLWICLLHQIMSTWKQRWWVHFISLKA